MSAVLEALLSLPTNAARLGILAGLSAPLSPLLIARLCAAVALHDAGKVNVGFFNRIRQQTGPKAGHIGPLVDLLFGGISEQSERRGAAVRRALREALGIRQMRPWFNGASDKIFEAVLAHHGSLPLAGRPDVSLWEPAEGYDPIAESRRLGEAIPLWFPAAFESGPAFDPTPRFLHAFVGFVTWADWLGSDARIFDAVCDPLAEDGGLHRIAFARARAADLLSSRAINPARRRAAAGVQGLLAWERLMPNREPRWAQREMLTLPLPIPGEIRVLDAETGSGKTEAALIHFLRLLRAGLVDGLYFALPTRAAAVQIQRRVHKLLEQWLGHSAPPVGLAVPGYLRVDGWDGQQSEVDWSVLWPDDPNDTLHDRGWAVEIPKRYVTGAVMVGTIDQLLLGGMRVRHAHLRSGPMLRQLLVIDEVHASDTYMTVLLRQVLDQHSQAGGHALLMSATLGSAARHYLLTGTMRSSPTTSDGEATPYPAIISTSGLMRSAESSEVGAGKLVRITIEEDHNAFRAASLAARGAERGARVLVMRNLVGLAQETQTALEAQLAVDWLFRVKDVPAPHHGRFAPEDRRLLDAALEAAFGKDAPRRGVVAVTTQTAEQSLDIDADLLITDLCPADVLLQRIGRLHRHTRERPAGFETPRVIVLAPTVAEMENLLDHKGELRGHLLGFGPVYPDLSILAATRRELEAAPAWDIPAMNRGLVERTTHPDALDAVCAKLGSAWVKHRKEIMRGHTNAHAAQARHACLMWDEWDNERRPMLARDERLATRLGLGRRVAAIRPVAPGPFAEPVGSVPIPSWMLADGTDVTEAEDVIPDIDGLRFRFAGRGFRYDRMGLRPLANG